MLLALCTARLSLPSFRYPSPPAQPAHTVAVVIPVTVDWDLVRQAHANAVAGAVAALGYRYAGTADARAARAIITYMHRFMAMRAAGGGGGSRTVAGGTVRCSLNVLFDVLFLCSCFFCSTARSVSFK